MFGRYTMSVSWLHSVLADLYEWWYSYSLGCGQRRREEEQNASLK